MEGGEKKKRLRGNEKRMQRHSRAAAHDWSGGCIIK